MPFDEETVGYLSATDTLENLNHWFPNDDIKRLEKDGFCVMAYESDDYKFHNNHYLINQETSRIIGVFTIKELEYGSTEW